ncbi:MAG: multiheme c-type cytochrome, partial [Planctomycetota bacterium]
MKKKRLFFSLILFFFWLYCLYLVYQSTLSPVPTQPFFSEIKAQNKGQDSTPFLPGAVNFTQNESCQSCHPEVYQEWLSSFHAKSWSNPDFQAHLKLYRANECLACHIPEPPLLRKEGPRQC